MGLKVNGIFYAWKLHTYLVLVMQIFEKALLLPRINVYAMG
jgi:hypothetical protein